MKGFSNRLSCMRAVLSLAAALVFAASAAIVPDEQFVPKTILEAVVRIQGTAGNGTGSVIDKKPQYDRFGNQIGWFLCVLTANHVVKNSQDLTVGFNNIGNPHGAPYSAWIAAEGRFKDLGGKSPDIAILGVKAQLNDFLNRLTPLNVIDDTNYNPGDPFTVVGYGFTGFQQDINGDGVPDGYREVAGTYGNKRFANNTFDRKINTAWGQWSHDAWEYDLTGPAPGIDGEGFPLRGDSGGPLLVQSPVGIPIQTQPPRVINAFTRGIVGIVSDGDYFHGNFVRWNLEKERDVRITPLYKDWIMRECEAVPEPSSILALMTATILIVVRRRRTRV
ncbi:MAG: trypsin-like serine protease [Candidatus Methanosuratincola sp.]